MYITVMFIKYNTSRDHLESATWRNKDVEEDQDMADIPEIEES